MFYKKGVFKNWQENIVAGDPFLIKMQKLWHACFFYEFGNII